MHWRSPSKPTSDRHPGRIADLGPGSLSGHDLLLTQPPAIGNFMRIADVYEFGSVFRNAPEAEAARSGRNSPATWKADDPDRLDVVPEPAILNAIKPSTDRARRLDKITCTF